MTARKDWFGTITGNVVFDPNLSPNACRIYCVLVMFRNRDDDTCYPSNETISRHSGMSLASVRRGLAELVGLGIITREPRYLDGRQTTSLTYLNDWNLSNRVLTGDTPGVLTGEQQNTPTSNTNRRKPDSSTSQAVTG